MDHLAFGIFLVTSGALYKHGQKMEIIANRNRIRLVITMIATGALFMLAGTVLMMVKQRIELPGIVETVMLFIAYFFLLTYARILNIAETVPAGRQLLLRNDLPLLWVARVAFYAGPFMRTGPFLLVIHGCQIALVLILSLLIKLLAF